MTLNDLIAALERAEGPSRELDYAIAHAVGHDIPITVEGMADIIYRSLRDVPHHNPMPYTASIDAALTLVPEGASWQLGWEEVNPHGIAWVGRDGVTCTAATPALALCIAALKARKETE